MAEPLDRARLRRRIAVAAALFLVTAVALALTLHDPGLTWDEPIYYRFAIGCLNWFDAPRFDAAGLNEAWGLWQVHPPLGSVLIAAALRLFGGELDMMGAARLGNALLFAATVAALYLWAAARRGERAGWMAAAAFALMPRVLPHGWFANLEMPMLLLGLLTTIAFEEGIRDRRWSIACGVLFGLALLTKVNALFLPVALVPWGLLVHGRKAARNLIAMALLGPLLFFAGWPALWHAPLASARHYLADKAHRWLIPVYYLGRIYRAAPAPWHYPFVMLLAATPLPILAGAAVGVARLVRGIRTSWRERGHELLALWSMAVPILVIALPGVPKYDGVRLLLPAMPFLAVLAAYGADAALTRLRPRAAAAASALLLLWLLLPIIVLHPFQLCYYGELAGGPWGARRIGFETTFWNDTFNDEALEAINRTAPPNARVAVLAVGEFVWPFYRVTGAARSDLKDGDFDRGEWDVLVVVPREGWLTEEQKRAVAALGPPAWARRLPAFPSITICSVYVRGTP